MANKSKLSAVAWAMRYSRIVIMVTCVLIAVGIYGLYDINKNEFPTITIRQGVVVAVYPGASAQEIEQQVTKPLEDYIFTYKDVKKEKTKSYSRNSVAIIQVELNDDVQDKDAFWSKFKHGVEVFKSSLPQGVLAVQVNDDFGDSSAMLITMESNDKTYRELGEYMDDLKDRLRTVPSVGRMTVVGQQQEQVSVYLDYDRLAHYGISDKVIAMALKTRDFTTTAGTLKSGQYDSPIYVSRSMNLVSDVEQMVVYTDPRGTMVRLKDIATVKREYPAMSSYITNNGVKCLVLSIEMKPGQSITDMGKEIYKVLDDFEPTLPQDVKLYRVTDQALVVGNSIVNFLKELLIAIVAVIIVVLLLMPLRVALVAASTIPISIFISLGLFYAADIELNTVTLAALIVSLGMIVDNSIVIIDSYMEKLGEGMSRWHASVLSATHFFKSILTATLAISITFFPFLITTTGSFYDTLRLFPWSITIILLVSLAVAELVVPFLQYWFIRKPMKPVQPQEGQKEKFNFLNLIQRHYERLIDWCFGHRSIVMGMAVLSVVLAVILLANRPMRLMPLAERDQFAVEIYLPSGTAIGKTAALADSIEGILHQDERVVSIASFKGTASPRFHTVYAPQFGGSNYAQFIVNTVSEKATDDMLNEYRPRLSEAFPEAYVRLKQLSFGAEANPIEIRLTCEDWKTLRAVTDSLTGMLRSMPDLRLVRNDMNEPLLTTRVNLDPEKASRLGITNLDTELSLMMRYNSDGMPLGTIWQGDYPVNVCLKSNHADQGDRQGLGNEMVAAYGGATTVPLRQVASITPDWQDGQIAHRNGLRTTTIMAEVADGLNVTSTTVKLQKRLKDYTLPEGVTMTWGGEYEENIANLPTMFSALAIAVMIIFFLLVYHFKRISTATLLLFSLTLCFFGTAVGIFAHGELTMTCFLGFISLMGILVRNAIIMYDYAEELQAEEHLPVREAIILSAKRRMRPIFLTSAAASMGVIPMILSGSKLWAPMANVIFYGTLITMLFILTVLPVAYWLTMTRRDRKRTGVTSISQ